MKTNTATAVRRAGPADATPDAIALYRSLGFAEPPSLSLRRVRQAEHR
ncbi:hypothetical protein BH24ACT11_BH24ACT11_00040 [soil metagenome]